MIHSRQLPRPRSVLPGRERWAAECLRSRSGLARDLRDRLLENAAVEWVEVNPVTGRILVLYAPGSLVDGVGPLLYRALEGLLADGLPEPDRPDPRRRHPVLELIGEAGVAPGLLSAAALASVLNTLTSLLPYLGHSASVAVARGRGMTVGSGPLSSPRLQLGLIGVLTFGAMGANQIAETVRRRLWRLAADQLEQRVQLSVVERLLDLDMAYLDEQGTGSLMSVIQGDSNQVYDLLEGGAHDAIQKVAITAGVGLTLLMISPTLALVTFLPFPIVYLSSKYFQQRIARRFAAAGQAQKHYSRLLANSLAGVATIKSFTAEDREIARLQTVGEDVLAARDAAFRISLSTSNFLRPLTGLSFTLSIMTGGILYAGGAISFSVYSLLLFMVPQLMWVVQGIDENYDMYQKSLSSARRLLEILARRPTIVGGPKSLPPARVEGQIEFRDVVFGYDEPAGVFRDLDLQVEPGCTIALVGSTGGGKSTVLKLLMRYYDVTAGQVLLDGIDVRALSLDDLRRSIAYVSQDVYLFHGTVFENIALGCPTATAAEVEDAARVAHAHEFIRALPAGYDTVVGERGQKLSGGQRQRLSIARAVLKDAPVLALDEATSSLDNETEAAVQASMMELTRDRTTLVIAHRLSTVRRADRIYVLDQGGVREHGTHDELLARDELYAGLWKIQATSLRGS